MSENRFEITERGKAVIESGLTLRQAHEIERDCSAEKLCASCELIEGQQ